MNRSVSQWINDFFFNYKLSQSWITKWKWCENAELCQRWHFHEGKKRDQNWLNFKKQIWQVVFLLRVLMIHFSFYHQLSRVCKSLFVILKRWLLKTFTALLWFLSSVEWEQVKTLHVRRTIGKEMCWIDLDFMQLEARSVFPFTWLLKKLSWFKPRP